VEDHGYILDLGIPGISGFLSYKNAQNGPYDPMTKLHVGQIIDTTVTKVSGNGRSLHVSIEPESFVSSSVCH